MASHRLSDADLLILRDMIDRQKRGVVNARNRHDDEPNDSQSPEVFIAKTPGGGIAARSILTPGHATCDIYKNVLNSAGTARTLDQVGVLVQEVYNHTLEVVPGSTYIAVVRDKLGIWWAVNTDSSFSPPPGYWEDAQPVTQAEFNERIARAVSFNGSKPIEDEVDNPYHSTRELGAYSSDNGGGFYCTNNTTTFNTMTAAGGVSFSFDVGYNEIWSFEFHLITIGTADGMQFKLYDASSSLSGAVSVVGTTSSASSMSVDRPLFNVASAIYCNYIGTGIVNIKGQVRSAAAALSPVALQFAAVTATQQNKILIGSHMWARRIGNYGAI